MCHLWKFATKSHSCKITLNECTTFLRENLDQFASELNRIVPGIISSGQVILLILVKISEKICKSHKNSVLKELSQGILSGFVCTNSQTQLGHWEEDCSYTMIAVPLGIDGMNSLCYFVFEFFIDWGKLPIQIALIPGTVLYYNGYSIMHRQISISDMGLQEINDFFCNLSTYGNKRFYTNCITSFKRLYIST